MPETRTCTKCKVEQPIEQFYRNQRTGYTDSHCKGCKRKYIRSKYVPKEKGRGPDPSDFTALTSKVCRRCEVEKPISEFSVQKRKAKNGTGHRVTSWCKPCVSEYSKSWHAANSDKKKADYQANIEERRAYGRANILRRKYGITPEQYAAFLEAQGGGCAICGGTGGMSHMVSPLVVDHDHATGEVRALLCAACNTGIGLFAESPDRLLAAATYLLRFTNVLMEVK